MADQNTPVPVWTLGTEAESFPDLLGDGELMPERLGSLRTALAMLAQVPIATLELHQAAMRRDPAGGIALHAGSPLAQQLSQLLAQTSRATAGNGEVLYRMVVPAKFAAQLESGLVKPMASASVQGGVHSALVGSKQIAGQAAFVPVVADGAAVGAGATAAAGVTAAGVLTVAAPLVLMAVAVAASAHAEQQRAKSVERITDLLERLHDDKLEDEVNRLNACRDAIDKATAVLLDQGRVGHSLGLDSASHEISFAITTATSRLGKWQGAMAGLEKGPVELPRLTEAFPGITDENGEFFAHLEAARLAIALKRRLLVLQAVEHAQLEAGNPFTAFLMSLSNDGRSLDDLDRGIEELLLRLSALQLRLPTGLLHKLHYAPSDVDELLAAVYRLKALGSGRPAVGGRSDVVIEIEQGRDGSVVVFPAQATAA